MCVRRKVCVHEAAAFFAEELSVALCRNQLSREAALRTLPTVWSNIFLILHKVHDYVAVTTYTSRTCVSVICFAQST